MMVIVVKCRWTVLFLLGHLWDFCGSIFKRRTKKGYAPIRQSYEDFYTRRVYYRTHVRCGVLGMCI